MKTYLVLGVLFLLSFKALAQTEVPPVDGAAVTQDPPADTNASVDTQKQLKPKSRLKNKNNLPPAEDSSFMGDSDNIDPLNPNRDNIKDDVEPILTDIKEVSNTGTRKQKAEELVKEQEAAAAAAAAKAAEDAKKAAEDAAKIEAEKRKQIVLTGGNLSADNPDLALEKKFHDIYQKYNVNPTRDDVWAAASEKQTARQYLVQKGDTLWSISKILFGDPNFWPKLWSFNKQGILNPHFINPKMKVYFFDGDEQNSPTLSVGDLNTVPVRETPPSTSIDVPLLNNDNESKPKISTITNINPPIKVKPNSEELAKLAEVNKDIPPIIDADGSVFAAKTPIVEPSGRVQRTKYKRPTNLPLSFSVGLNEAYYNTKKKKDSVIDIDLGKPIKSQFYYANDIILTDLPVLSEVKIKLEETQKMRCTTGRLLKDIEFSGDLVAEYEFYENIDDVDTTTGTKYGYRYIGKAKQYQDKYLRIIDCKGLMSTDLIILPKNKLKELATTKLSDEVEARIIGGPDFNKQRFYSSLYYGYIDFGNHEYTVGNEYKTVSEITDKVNGEFKVVEKFGSYAVVIFTNVKDQISIGDRVKLQ